MPSLDSPPPGSATAGAASLNSCQHPADVHSCPKHFAGSLPKQIKNKIRALSVAISEIGGAKRTAIRDGAYLFKSKTPMPV